MVYSKPLNTLVVLTLLSFAKGFTLLGDWTLRRLTADTITGIANHENGGNPPITTIGSSIDLGSVTGCSSISLSGGQTWSLTADASNLIGVSESTFGFWVNFESTISERVFEFGPNDDGYYVVSSPIKDGNLEVFFVDSTGSAISTNSIFFTVPLNKWCFIAFHFKDNSGIITLEVLLTGIDLISKTSTDFIMPNGKFNFGYKIKGKFHRVILTKSATINASFDTITLDDGSNQDVIAAPCTPGTCIDSICPQSFGSLTGNICLSSLQYCTTCDANGCTTCDPDSARDEGTYCQNCKDNGTTNELKNYHCCAKASHCVECSVKSTQCDLCVIGYFLYDSPTSKSCLSCADSCTNCQPGPECYTCAETVTQTGTTCRVDSVGLRVSVDIPNIVFDFAYPLSTGLSKSSFKATSNSGSDIPTSGWTFSGCTTGLKQCKILAPNIQESDLPIALDFDFTQV
ncbi:unnamed protein product [Blepharisma stoltei]|uniref:Uncharacterized protein n=1 Tax=Blepharisma stoltei TaxID=1481888 RepID=A0AAU9KBD3_9CILI|nr:unnamed protein product [Blepharisma stoltei]